MSFFDKMYHKIIEGFKTSKLPRRRDCSWSISRAETAELRARQGEKVVVSSDN